MATDFGQDVSCTDVLRSGRIVSGAYLVAEAAYRRLITPRGTLRDDEDYGLDLPSYLGEQNPTAVAAALPGLIRQELKKDERIDTVDTIVAVSYDGPAATLTVVIKCTTALGPFTLKVAVADASATLLGIS